VEGHTHVRQRVTGKALCVCVSVSEYGCEFDSGCACVCVCVCVSCGRPHTCQAARHRQGFVRLRECE